MEFRFGSEEESQPSREVGGFRFVDQSATPQSDASFRFLQREDPTALSYKDKVPGLVNFATDALRPVTRLKGGVLNTLGAIPDTLLLGLNVLGIVDDDTASQWREWGAEAKQRLSQGAEGFVLDQAIKNIEGAPPELELETLMREGDNFANSTLPQGLGSLAGFALSSYLTAPRLVAAGMTAQKAQFVAPAILGSIVNSNELYHDAVDHEATSRQRAVAWGMGALTGPLEAVSIGRMMGRMDSIGARAFHDLMFKRGMEPWRAFTSTQAGVAGIKGFLEEGAQEFAQEWLANWTAKTVAGYDPERNYFDNVWAAGGTGAVTGFIGSAFLTTIGIRGARLRALRGQEWQVTNGVAQPPAESGWEVGEGGTYSKGDLVIEPISDGPGNTRWQVRNAKGAGAQAYLHEEELFFDLAEEHSYRPKNEREVQYAWERGDYIYREDSMESGITRLTTLEQVMQANPTDLEILPLSAIREANKNVEVLGSWLRPETAANMGDKFLNQGHLGMDLVRGDFFGEFNAITEVMRALQEKRWATVQQLEKDRIKFDQNEMYVDQLTRLAEMQTIFEETGDRGVATGRSVSSLDFASYAKADTEAGYQFANRAIAQKQIMDPRQKYPDYESVVSELSVNDYLIPAKAGGELRAGPLEILPELGKKANKGEALFIFNGNLGEALKDSKQLGYVHQLVKMLKPKLRRAINRAGIVYQEAKRDEAGEIEVDANGQPVMVDAKPAFIIRFSEDPSGNAGFIESAADGSAFFMEINVREVISAKRDLDRVAEVEAHYNKLVENKTLTQGEAARAFQQWKDTGKWRLRKANASLIDTALHEFGHLSTINKIRNMLVKYHKGTASQLEVDQLKAIYLAYFDFLAEQQARGAIADIAIGDSLTTVDFVSNELFPDSSRRERHNQLFSAMQKDPTTQYNMLDQALHRDSPLRPSSKRNNYLLSLTEFLANQAARYELTGNMDTLPQKMHSTIKEAHTSLKNLYEDLNTAAGAGELGGRPYPSVKHYFEMLDADTSVKLQGALDSMGTATLKDIINRKVEGFDPDVIAAFNEGADSFSFAHDWMLNLEHIAQLNKHNQPLQDYRGFVHAWSRSVGQTINAAEDTMTLARKHKLTGKEKGAKLGKVLFHEADTETELTFEQKEALVGEWTTQMQEVYDSIKANFRKILERMRQVTLNDAQANFRNDPQKLAQEEARINKEFDEMAAKPYFPYMRFGKWTITVKAREEFVDTDGSVYKPGQIVRFETFDSRVDRAISFRKLNAKYGKKHTVGQGLMSDTRGSLQAMPVSFLRAIKRQLGAKLPADVKAELDEIIQEYSPGESFKQAHFKRRKGTKGYNLDWQRSFAAYMRQAAGHIARMEYQPLMTEVLKDMEEDAKHLNQTANGDKRTMILNWSREHMDYIMNPSIEWAGLRGFMFQWFLGFNIKSAVVNATQLPLVTYPYLAARYGDLEASRALATATRDAILFYKHPERVPQRTGRSTRGAEAQMIEELLDRQILEQSLATELALAASSAHLDRYTLAPGMKKAWYKVSEWGAMPFHTVEKLNRVTTALAAYRLARNSGMNHALATDAAHDAVLKTQYDYSKWNRAKFMRGRKGIVFLFMNYVQNTLFFGLGGDPGAMRHQLMLFMLAGMLGLPFMEDLMTLFDWGSEKIKRMTGTKEPYTDIRKDLHEFVRELGMNPDMFLHGASADSLGMATLGRAAGLGAWVPQFDLSASISMGRIVPGIDSLREQGENFEAGVVRGLERSGGAFLSSAIQAFRAATSNDPNTWKRVEKGMPAFARNMARARRLAAEGREQTKSGQIIAEFDPSNPRDAAELGLLAVGFQPRRLTEGWRSEIHKRQGVQYYEVWKRQISRQFNFAMASGDREAIADMRKAVRQYNNSVPFPEMSITGDYLRQSLQTYLRERAKAEAGVPSSPSTFRFERSIEEVFSPRTSGDN
jgi:hypothetical protein